MIAGGGLAGLTLARQLQREAPHVKVLVLEKRKHPVREAAFKVGESSVEIGAHYFRSVLGLEPVLREQHLEKLGLRYFFPQGANDDITRRTELGPPSFPVVPSFQLDRGRLENWLLASLRESGVDVLDDCSVKRIDRWPRRPPHAGIRGTRRVRYRADAVGRRRQRPDGPAASPTGAEARGHRTAPTRCGSGSIPASRSTTGPTIRRGSRGCRPASAG